MPRPTLADIHRDAIRQACEQHNPPIPFAVLCRVAEVSRSTACRFMTGAGATLDVVDRLHAGIRKITGRESRPELRE